MTATLPEADRQIKTLNTQRLHLPLANLTQSNIGLGTQTLPAHSRGSVVVRCSVGRGIGVEIIAEHSDEEDALSQRLTSAQPVLELLQRIFTVDQLTSQSFR